MTQMPEHKTYYTKIRYCDKGQWLVRQFTSFAPNSWAACEDAIAWCRDCGHEYDPDSVSSICETEFIC